MDRIAQEHLEPEAPAASAVQRSVVSAVQLQVQTDSGHSHRPGNRFPTEPIYTFWIVVSAVGSLLIYLIDHICSCELYSEESLFIDFLFINSCICQYFIY